MLCEVINHQQRQLTANDVSAPRLNRMKTKQKKIEARGRLCVFRESIIS
jgi:hypothetical protein